jgi:hypothetical protein
MTVRSSPGSDRGPCRSDDDRRPARSRGIRSEQRVHRSRRGARAGLARQPTGRPAGLAPPAGVGGRPVVPGADAPRDGEPGPNATAPIALGRAPARPRCGPVARPSSAPPRALSNGCTGRDGGRRQPVVQRTGAPAYDTAVLCPLLDRPLEFGRRADGRPSGQERDAVRDIAAGRADGVGADRGPRSSRPGARRHRSARGRRRRRRGRGTGGHLGRMASRPL